MIEHRIRSVMADVLGVRADAIDDRSSPETIETWDSLRHMTLILAIEEELGVQFDGAMVPELTGFGALREESLRLLSAPCS